MSEGLRTLAAGPLAAAMLAVLAACGPTATPDPGPGSTPSANGVTVSQSPSGQPNSALPSNGSCVLISSEKAAELVGSAVTSSPSAGAGAGIPGAVYVDGCAYAGTPGTLSYDVVNLNDATTAAALINRIKAAAAATPGTTPFDVTGGDESLGYTTTIGGQTTASVGMAQGTYQLGVTATAADTEPAKKTATGALALLLDAVA